MRICTAAQMREAEAAAVAAGTSYETLMENAGQKAAGEIQHLAASKPLKILILCGKGNNGGDGLVIARALSEAGWAVQAAFLCGDELSPLSRLNWERLPEAVQIITPEQLSAAIGNAAYIVDGVFGIGFHGELPEAVQAVFELANRSKTVRIALDLPSGMNCDTGEASPNTFQADYTYTFGAYKPALLMKETEPFCGQVERLEIGL